MDYLSFSPFHIFLASWYFTSKISKSLKRVGNLQIFRTIINTSTTNCVREKLWILVSYIKKQQPKTPFFGFVILTFGLFLWGGGAVSVFRFSSGTIWIIQHTTLTKEKLNTSHLMRVVVRIAVYVLYISWYNLNSEN